MGVGEVQELMIKTLSFSFSLSLSLSPTNLPSLPPVSPSQGAMSKGHGRRKNEDGDKGYLIPTYKILHSLFLAVSPMRDAVPSGGVTSVIGP